MTNDRIFLWPANGTNEATRHQGRVKRNTMRKQNAISVVLTKDSFENDTLPDEIQSEIGETVSELPSQRSRSPSPSASIISSTMKLNRPLTSPRPPHPDSTELSATSASSTAVNFVAANNQTSGALGDYHLNSTLAVSSSTMGSIQSGKQSLMAEATAATVVPTPLVAPVASRATQDRLNAKMDPSAAALHLQVVAQLPATLPPPQLSQQTKLPAPVQTKRFASFATTSRIQLNSSCNLNTSRSRSSRKSQVINPDQCVSLATNLSANNLHLTLNDAPDLQRRKSFIGKLKANSFQAQRLSDVSAALGQRISAKMGLGLPASQGRVVEQTRWLYLRYIYVKLRQNSLPLRGLNLTDKRALGSTYEEYPEAASGALSAPVIPINEQVSLVSQRLSGTRKRTAMSQNIDVKDLRLLTSRIMQQAPSSQHTLDAEYQRVSGGQPSDSMGVGSVRTPNRKHLMDAVINKQILAVISGLIRELRAIRPDYYGDTIYEQIGIDKFNRLETLIQVQRTICQEMMRSEISWCRISALFSLFGAMSLDCVRLGSPEYVGPLLDGFIGFVERDLALWISQQGGWESFLYKYQAGFRLGPLATKAIIMTLPIVCWFLVSMFQ